MRGCRVPLRVQRAGIGLLVGILLAGVVADPADARSRRKRSFSSYQPPYAAIVVDANSGQALHATNPDATRHPASLTKIMTLYLLFEQIDAGRIKLDTAFPVSEHAAAQAPSKLGLKPGHTITAEDAIKALITKSANDAAVVVAEALAGDEDEFAKRMTRKARALGMTRTVYANASGLPDPDQVTTARDQSVLGRAIQDRFPRYYRYFATSSFQYRGVAMRNHNKLLGRVQGVDGIKTGYTRASGFNLVTSMRRGNRHVVAVVLGGSSGGQRDARMRALLDTHIVTASTQRTASKIAEAPQPADSRAPARTAARPTTAPAQGGMALASAQSTPIPAPAAAMAPTPAPTPVPITTAREDSMSTGAIRPAPGSDEPLQPLSVKTIMVRVGSIQAAAMRAFAVPGPIASSPPQMLALAPLAEPAPIPAPTFAERMSAADSVMQRNPAPSAPERAESTPPSVAPASAAASARPASAPSSAATPARAAPAKGDWVIQVGAFPDETAAKERLKAAQSEARTLLAKADPYTERVVRGTQELYRARFVVNDQSVAETACKQLKRKDIACMALRN